ncbi:hypothetical protein DBR32_03750 [Taibaiella sp. KBW10]|uniref:glycosyltransferase n=1 Tax=Taibaiella sp. KBW10 TaxID=2153357 RepID=UPI000F5A942F|nr:glycosyltransferase [Taibaiella sp. KBW10]RQO31930.1 hypothetical protein DBR32_03750 [Taibaiella sp. KBW10]
MNTPKKIAFVIESLDCGGAEKSLVTLLQNLDYKQLKVDLLLLNRGGVFEQFVPENVVIRHLDLFSKGNKINNLLQRARYFYLRKFGNKQQHSAQKFWKAFKSSIPVWPQSYDVAISYSQGFCTYYVATRVEAAKKITWLNTDYLKAGYDAAFDFPYYKQYAKVVPVSEEGASVFNQAMNRFGKLDTHIIKDISDKKVIVAQSKEGIKEVFDAQQTNIVTVCRLEPPKGLDLAVAACSILKKKGYNIHWYLVGDGSERRKIESEISALQLTHHFTLLGFRENPYPYMARADIYVQTSRYEGWGLTLIEATLLQKPIVTTNFPTAQNIVQEGINGYIVAMDAAALAEKIIFLMEHKEIAIRMSEQVDTYSEQNKEHSLANFYQLINN